MEPFSISCTTCQARLTVRSQAAIGQIMSCPKCSSMVLVEPQQKLVIGMGSAAQLDAPLQDTLRLADTPTRLKRLPEERQQQLMNWGYAVCDAAIRKHSATLVANASPDPKFPFDAGLV